MLTFKCINSGSDGNCYLLDSGDEAILLDAGVSFPEIKKALDFDIARLKGAFVTHGHMDHAKSVRNLVNAGIPTYMPYAETMPVRVKVGGFQVLSFPLRTKDGQWLHTNGDGTECPIYGFLINHDWNWVLYVTDFLACPHTFRSFGLDTIVVACNHMDDADYGDQSAHGTHAILGHSSVSTVCDLVVANKTIALQNVILCHLSSDADDVEMVNKVRKAAGLGVGVTVCKPKTRVKLSKTPF